MARNWGQNVQLNQALAAATGYSGDFGGGKWSQWYESQPAHIKDLADPILNPQPWTPPPGFTMDTGDMVSRNSSRDWGENVELNKALAQATGYSGDFGGGKWSRWYESQPEAVKAKASPVFDAVGAYQGQYGLPQDERISLLAEKYPNHPLTQALKKSFDTRVQQGKGRQGSDYGNDLRDQITNALPKAKSSDMYYQVRSTNEYDSGKIKLVNEDSPEYKAALKATEGSGGFSNWRFFGGYGDSNKASIDPRKDAFFGAKFSEEDTNILTLLGVRPDSQGFIRGAEPGQSYGNATGVFSNLDGMVSVPWLSGQNGYIDNHIAATEKKSRSVGSVLGDIAQNTIGNPGFQLLGGAALAGNLPAMLGQGVTPTAGFGETTFAGAGEVAGGVGSSAMGGTFGDMGLITDLPSGITPANMGDYGLISDLGQYGAGSWNPATGGYEPISSFGTSNLISGAKDPGFITDLGGTPGTWGPNNTFTPLPGYGAAGAGVTGAAGAAGGGGGGGSGGDSPLPPASIPGAGGGGSSGGSSIDDLFKDILGGSGSNVFADLLKSVVPSVINYFGNENYIDSLKDIWEDVDPWKDYRKDFANAAYGMQVNPDAYLNDPMHQYAQKAASRKMASMGLRRSGASLSAAADTAAKYFMDRQNQLATLGGASIHPFFGGTLGVERAQTQRDQWGNITQTGNLAGLL